MDDDGGDWFSSADEPAAEPEPVSLVKRGSAAAPAAVAAAAGEAAGGEAGEAAAPGAEEKREEAADEEFLDPDKLLLFKHWIRPKFLPYKYLYDYRHNYYDDVIDYLDKRQRGINRDPPVPQTWAERVLRTYTNRLNRNEIFKRKLQDKKLVEKTRLSGAIHSYHTKAYFNRTYSNILSIPLK